MENNQLTELIDRYCAAWRERNADARREILEQVWHREGRYSDPRAEVTGRPALCDLIGEIQASLPDGKVMRLSPVDSHHGYFRFTWAIQMDNGSQRPESVDFGRLAEDGRILEIVGFFGLIGGQAGRK